MWLENHVNCRIIWNLPSLRARNLTKLPKIQQPCWIQIMMVASPSLQEITVYCFLLKCLTLNLANTFKHTYQKDKFYSKILGNPKAYALFWCKDGLIFTKNLLKQDILCIPHEAFQKGRWVIEIIINYAHMILGHFGQFKTAQYIRRYFWWMSMAQDIQAFHTSCSACTAAKDATSKPFGLLLVSLATAHAPHDV